MAQSPPPNRATVPPYHYHGPPPQQEQAAPAAEDETGAGSVECQPRSLWFGGPLNWMDEGTSTATSPARPRSSVQDDSSQEIQPKRINLPGSFSLSWCDKSKVSDFTLLSPHHAAHHAFASAGQICSLGQCHFNPLAIIRKVRTPAGNAIVVPVGHNLQARA